MVAHGPHHSRWTHDALRSRSEPLLIPKLQSRFADFPWTRCPLTRGCPPWRPVAVIGTVFAVARTVSGRRRTGVRAPGGAGSRAELFPSHASGHAGSTSGHAGRRRGCCAVVAIARVVGIFTHVPFGTCEAVAVRLGPNHPKTVAVASETCSTSVVFLHWCYSNRDLDRRVVPGASGPPFEPRAATPYLARASAVWVAGCSAINFPGARIRQVSSNTLLGGCRL